MVNLYEILELSADASNSEIKKAFRKKAKQYHPDVSNVPDAQVKFNEVYSAYEILGDLEKRKYYDQLLTEPVPNTFSNTEYESYDDSVDDDYIYEWRQNAYATAKGFGNMTFKDFREQAIHLHQWSSSKFIEWALNTAIILLMAFGIFVIFESLPYEGDEFELRMKERYLGFGSLVSLVCSFLILNTLRIQLHNFKVSQDLGN